MTHEEGLSLARRVVAFPGGYTLKAQEAALKLLQVHLGLKGLDATIATLESLAVDDPTEEEKK